MEEKEYIITLSKDFHFLLRKFDKILKTIISIVPEIIYPKILFFQTFVFRTLQEHFVFIGKKRKFMLFSWYEMFLIIFLVNKFEKRD